MVTTRDFLTHDFARSPDLAVAVAPEISPLGRGALLAASPLGRCALLTFCPSLLASSCRRHLSSARPPSQLASPGRPQLTPVGSPSGTGDPRGTGPGKEFAPNALTGSGRGRCFEEQGGDGDRLLGPAPPRCHPD